MPGLSVHSDCKRADVSLRTFPWGTCSCVLSTPCIPRLEAAGGPTVGPEVALRPAGMGNARVDAVLHDGDVWVSWTERTASTTYELMAARLSDLSTDSPILTDIASLWSGGAKVATGTLVPTDAGLRVAARTQKLRIYSHISGTSWTQGSGNAALNGKARPSAVALDTGAILVAAQSDPKNDVVKIFRFSNNGTGSPGMVRRARRARNSRKCCTTPDFSKAPRTRSYLMRPTVVTSIGASYRQWVPWNARVDGGRPS